MVDVMLHLPYICRYGAPPIFCSRDVGLVSLYSRMVAPVALQAPETEQLTQLERQQQ